MNQKQKADRAKAEAMIEAMKAMYAGQATPPAKPKPKPFTKLKKPKKEETGPVDEVPKVQVEIVEPAKSAEVVIKQDSKEEDEDVKDSWDIESDDDGKA